MKFSITASDLASSKPEIVSQEQKIVYTLNLVDSDPCEFATFSSDEDEEIPKQYIVIDSDGTSTSANSI